MRVVRAVVGIAIGALVGWFLPAALIPRPYEFDFLAIIGWRIVLIPAGAVLGLMIGLMSRGGQAANRREKPPSKTDERGAVPTPTHEHDLS